MSFLRRAGAEIARLIASVSDPAAEANRVLLYSKTVSGVAQLFARLSNGNIYQISGDVARFLDSVSDPTTDASRVQLYGKGVSGTVHVFARTSDGSITQLSGDVARLSVRQTYTKAQDVAPSALAYGANIEVDASLSNTFTVTLTGATAQLDNPTNLVDGQTLVFRLQQDATGGRGLTFDTAYDFGTEGVPNLTTSGSGVLDIITGISDGTNIFCTALRGFTP